MTTGLAQQRGATPRGLLLWLAGVLAALLGCAWGTDVVARRQPLESAIAALEARDPRHPDVLFYRGVFGRDVEALGRAAQGSTLPALATAWTLCAVVEEPDGGCDAGTVEAALARWRLVDPENPLPDVLAANRLLGPRDRGAGAPSPPDVPRALAILDRALEKPSPRVYTHALFEMHLNLQARLGVADPVALCRDWGLGVHTFIDIRETARARLTQAEIALWEGRTAEARRLAAALGRFGERLAAGAQSCVDVLVARSVEHMGLRVEAQAALVQGDLERVRAIHTRRRALDEEERAATEGHERFERLHPLLEGTSLGRIGVAADATPLFAAIFSSERPWFPARVRNRAKETALLLRVWLARDEVERALVPPGGEYAALLALGRASPTLGPPPAGATSALDILLADPTALTPPPPEGGAPPAALTRWLSKDAQDASGGDLHMGAWVGPLILAWGPRAGPALAEAWDATKAEDRLDRFAPLLPLFFATRHPEREHLFDLMQSVPGIWGSALAAAAPLTEDREGAISWVRVQADLLDDRANREERVALDHVLRALGVRRP